MRGGYFVILNKKSFLLVFKVSICHSLTIIDQHILILCIIVLCVFAIHTIIVSGRDKPTHYKMESLFAFSNSMNHFTLFVNHIHFKLIFRCGYY